MKVSVSTGQWFLSTLKTFTWPMVRLVIVACVLGFVAALMPLVLQRIIDAALAGQQSNGLLLVYLALATFTIVPLTFILREFLIDRYVQQMRHAAFEHSLRQDVAFYEQRDSSVVTSQVSKGVSSSARLMSLLTTGQLLIDVPLALFAAVYIGRYSLGALAVLVAFLLIFAVVARVLGERLTEIEGQYQAIDTDLTARQRESVHNVATVRTHNAGQMIVGRCQNEGLRALRLQNKLTWQSAVFYLLGQGGHRLAEFVILVMFLPALADQSLSMGTFLALLMYAGYVVAPADFVGTIYAELKQAWANIIPLHELMVTQPQVTESTYPLQLPPMHDCIEFRGVCFGYDSGTRIVLDGLNLTIPAGKQTAIVGESGAGKSTIARLLMRLYDPDLGVVKYDGIDIRHVSFASMSEQVSYLSQEVPIFSGTIAENVAFGRADFTRDEVVAALGKAAADFVFTFEQGIDTEIGESGKNLSGGQRQRIAIARLFMGKPSVIILDEATSALDTKTEVEVTAAFDTLAKMTTGLTTIVIAHRLSTIMHADHIVVMDAGRVVATGTHAELLVSCQLYQELHGTFAS